MCVVGVGVVGVVGVVGAVGLVGDGRVVVVAGCCRCGRC